MIQLKWVLTNTSSNWLAATLVGRRGNPASKFCAAVVECIKSEEKRDLHDRYVYLWPPPPPPSPSALHPAPHSLNLAVTFPL